MNENTSSGKKRMNFLSRLTDCVRVCRYYPLLNQQKRPLILFFRLCQKLKSYEPLILKKKHVEVRKNELVTFRHARS